MYSSFITGSAHLSLYLTSSQFSHIILPAVHLSNVHESKIIRDSIFHTKKQDIYEDITLINCTFTFCSLKQTNETKGGAIYIDNQISLRAKNCVFRKNKAISYGSAIYAINATLIDISNCLFAENNCKRSGPLYLFDTGEVTIKNTNFTQNKSKLGSGAITLISIEKKVKLRNVLFFENIGRLYGTLFCNHTDLELNNCLFYFNQFSTGPTSIRLAAKATVIINNTVFADDNPPSVLLCKSCTINISHCSFSHSESESIRNRSGYFYIDNNTIFNSITKHIPIQLDPLENIFINMDNSTKRNRKNIKELNDKRSNKRINRKNKIETDEVNNIETNKENNNEINKENNNKIDNESNKETNKEDNNGTNKEDNNETNKENINETNKENNNETNKENNNETNKENNNETNKENINETNKENNNEIDNESSKEANKENSNEIDKENNKEMNKEDVIVKHGNKNQSFVLYPLQEKLNRKYSVFPLSFLIGIALILMLVIFFACCKDAREKMLTESVGGNYSIFNHDDLNSNENENNYPHQDEKLSDINIDNLPNVQMEKF